MLPKLLTVDDVCEYLGLGRTVVYETVRTGDIPHIRIRGRIRVSEDDLLDYLKKNKREGVE